MAENSIMHYTEQADTEPNVETVGFIEHNGGSHFVPHVLLDSGAKRASYIGLDALRKLTQIDLLTVRHKARLGDGVTQVTALGSITLNLKIKSVDGGYSESLPIEFMVFENLGDSIIIGLPHLVRNFYPEFIVLL